MKILKNITILAALAVMPSLVQAQDLMAREAPADKRLKSADATTIIKHQQKIEEIQVAKNIYGNHWSNAGVNVYKGMAKPEELVIDLRDFSMPIKNRVVTSNFGYRARFGRNHYGTDINGYTGDTIYAAFSGKVRVRKYDARGFGYYIVIRHPNGLETVYGHLSKQLVNENQEVRSGQPIGLCGNTGHSFGSHLHFETRVMGEAIDPAKMFNFAAADIKSDTYTYHSTGNTIPVAAPVNRSYAKSENTKATTTASSKSTSKGKSSSKSHQRRHTVKSGENPSTIARRYNMSVNELMKLNKGLKANRLRAGQTIIVKK